MGLVKKCELLYCINWGLAVCANFNLNTVGACIARPHNLTCGIVLFEKFEETVQTKPRQIVKPSATLFSKNHLETKSQGIFEDDC